ncbi:nitrilase-related carbon-nitrogen hydrolase [Clostridium autoethanogenum]|uniref:nitrilase-related carbon-nitrogen hydrolase n=1 Tax=Clostridium autoethanogenum TaxID=84023 RepID=UPI001A9BECB4|nr:nitrilase-related carbon-nitrogen hydrolase [Clostridium autoethanogenum]
MNKTVNVGLVQMNSKLGDVEEREGSDYKVFNTKLGKIGIIICCNAGFPEACRTLALEGADMVFIPAVWRIQDEYMWDLNLA